MKDKIICFKGMAEIVGGLICSVIWGISFLRCYMQGTQFSTVEKMIVIVFAFVVLIYGLYRRRYRLLLVFLSIVMLTSCFDITTFNPIDEAAHFDYINYIIDTGKVPLVGDSIDYEVLSQVTPVNIPGHPNHEPAQPPLYYCLMGIVFGLIGNIKLRFYLIRMFGIVFVFGTIFYIVKAYRKLRQGAIIEEDNVLFGSILCLFVITPGIMTRMLTVSNEGLNILLATMVTYYLVTMVVEGYSKKRLFEIVLLIVLNILTKNTSAYLVGGLILVLIYYKRIKEIFVAVILVALGISPWLICNLQYYGSFTGIKAHLDIVLPMVNPQNLPLQASYFTDAFSRFFSSYFIPSEMTFNGMFLYPLKLTALMIIVIMLIQAVRFIVFALKSLKSKLKFEYSVEEKRVIIKSMSLVLICLNILVIIAGSISSRVPLIVPRYITMSALPLIVLIYSTWVNSHKWVRMIGVVLFCGIVSMTLVQANVQFLM